MPSSDLMAESTMFRSSFFFSGVLFVLRPTGRPVFDKQEILAANPDAKVVVTVRDVDDWWRSFKATINFNNPLRVGWGE